MIVTRTVTQSDGAVAGARLRRRARAGIDLRTRRRLDRRDLGLLSSTRSPAAIAALRSSCAATARSTNPRPELITREGFASDVIAVADANGFETFDLIGCSLGGVVAFELWQRVPERLRSMVIVGSFAKYPDGQTYADNIEAAARAAGDMRTFAEARAAQLGLPPQRHARNDRSDGLQIGAVVSGLDAGDVDGRLSRRALIHQRAGVGDAWRTRRHRAASAFRRDRRPAFPARGATSFRTPATSRTPIIPSASTRCWRIRRGVVAPGPLPAKGSAAF